MNSPKLVLPHDIEGVLGYWHPKGYFPQAYIEADGGYQYPVYFAVPDVLKEEVEGYPTAKYLPNPWYFEPGLIVLAELTLENMERAVQDAWKCHFYESLVPRPPGTFDHMLRSTM